MSILDHRSTTFTRFVLFWWTISNNSDLFFRLWLKVQDNLIDCLFVRDYFGGLFDFFGLQDIFGPYATFLLIFGINAIVFTCVIWKDTLLVISRKSLVRFYIFNETKVLEEVELFGKETLFSCCHSKLSDNIYHL